MEQQDNFKWVQPQMREVYQWGSKLGLSEATILINIPLTWETLCLVDAIRHSFRKIIVLPLSSGKNSSLQPLVFKYLEKWKIIHYRSSSVKNRISALKLKPDIIIDCTFAISRLGFDKKLISSEALIIEQTRTGGLRLKDYFRTHRLQNRYYILDDNSAKKDFENEKGTGYSVVASLMGLGIFLEGKKVLVIGFGPVGRGTARYMKRLGACVTVAEINPELKRRARIEGFNVEKLSKTIRNVDIVVTATGKKNVIGKKAFAYFKDNVILVNAGAEVGEWDHGYLERKYKPVKISNFAICYSDPSGKKVIELGGGNSFNLVSGISISEFLDKTLSLAGDVITKYLESLQVPQSP